MLKGLAITPPVVGRISIGRIVEKNGKRIPEKDDQFTLTTQVQQRGEWMLQADHAQCDLCERKTQWAIQGMGLDRRGPSGQNLFEWNGSRFGRLGFWLVLE
ncbi:hypothetical protein BOC59_19395 [Burkholderia pseudomallei]|nr:hypothetical protein BOC59_19395 [Burkholderia pseudomallei]